MSSINYILYLFDNLKIALYLQLTMSDSIKRGKSIWGNAVKFLTGIVAVATIIYVIDSTTRNSIADDINREIITNLSAIMEYNTLCNNMHYTNQLNKILIDNPCEIHDDYFSITKSMINKFIIQFKEVESYRSQAYYYYCVTFTLDKYINMYIKYCKINSTFAAQFVKNITNIKTMCKTSDTQNNLNSNIAAENAFSSYLIAKCENAIANI